MLIDARRTSREVRAGLNFSWRRAGPMFIYRFVDGSFGDAWPPPAASRKAGVYRITICQTADTGLLYIGESGNVFERVRQHAQGTSPLSIEIRKALTKGQAVYVDTVVKARLQLASAPFSVDMQDVFCRRLVEAVAIVDEDNSARADQFLIMNRSKETNFWMKFNEIGMDEGIDEGTL